LSCSHAYHKQCLESFEKVTSTPSCPVCRTETYQKKRISDGHKQYLENCACVIQSHWRRHKASQEFNRLWATAPAPLHAQLRRKWVANKLLQKSDKLVRAMEDEVGDMDAFFRELDQEVARAHKSMTGSSESRTDTWRQPEVTSAERTSSQTARRRKQLAKPASADLDWAAALRAAQVRGHEDCPICMNQLCRRWKASAQCSLLSCSHCFHTQCIAAFEAFESGKGCRPLCPICREPYQRRKLKNR
jgi:IQ calmodulin-binding motif